LDRASHEKTFQQPNTEVGCNALSLASAQKKFKAWVERAARQKAVVK